LAIRIQKDEKTQKEKSLPRMKQRRYTREESLEMKRQLDELLKQGKIRVSRSDSAVATLFVPKADGTKRWCMDMRPVNEVTITDENKAPLQDISRERIQGAKFFTKLDLRDGYHHMRIREGDEKHTAFITEYGLYEWVVACFGLKNAPAEFARFMSETLKEYLNEFVVVYFDDIIIFAKTMTEHWGHVRKVLEKLRKAKINLKIKKCEFAVQEVEYLGHVVNGDHTKMQKSKIEAILNWPTPTTLKNIEEFRGLAGYYRQYIEKFSDKARPLNEALRKTEFKWGEEEEKAFQELKNSYRGNKILILFNPEKQIFVHTDASDYALGAEISQLDEQGRRRPVLFYSRKLLPAEVNYSTPDKEMLAIVQVMKKYQHYLRGTKYPVIVKSDHRNLRTFMTTKELNARQARWAEELSAYDFKIEHVKGKENVIADALSRRPDHKTEDLPNRTTQILKDVDGKLIINKELQLRMVNIERKDQELEEEIKRKSKNPNNRPEIKVDSDGFKRFQGLVLIPKELEEKVMRRYHDDIREGHPGEARMVEKIQRNYYFPGMIRKIRKFISKCENCQRNKVTHMKPAGLMQKWDQPPERPWQHITVDFVDMPETKDPVNHGIVNQMMVIVDRFSKQTILIPTSKDKNTKEIFHLMWERIFSIFGIPETMTSDRDKIFRSREWKELMEGIGSIQILSTSNHQQTDGQTERKIQEVQTYLRNYLDYDQKNWVELSPVTQYALNDAISTATNVTPNFAVFGTERRNGWDKPTDADLPLSEKMKSYHQQIVTELKWTKDQQKKYYDRRRVEAPSLKEGDRVYLKRRTSGQKKFNIKSLRSSQKLDHLKFGPFSISKKLKFDNYELKLPPRMKIHPIFHISVLEPTKNKETSEDVEAYEIEFEVEKVLNQRTRKGITEYLIQWKGYEPEDNSWEPTENLNCPDKVREYQKDRKIQNNRKP
jgi:RNase H-like domain found in reverse transcriptase/Reverse transcriptase (RNA-dependent DNA polymerase)/Integrase zinc binding domain/Chromo (CHRromatin Organisation MOdifier) domain